MLPEAHSRGAFLSRASNTLYEAGEQKTRLVCAVSAEHNASGGTPNFWFGFQLTQMEFLEAVPSAWLCLGCGSPRQTLVVPASVVKPLLAQMSETKGEDRHYWHIVVQRKDGKLVLRLLGGLDGPDLTEFLAPTEDLPTTVL